MTSNGNPNGAQPVYTALTSKYQADTLDEGRAAKPPGRWSPEEATRQINECANRGDFELDYVLKIGDAMKAKGLITGDLHHLLKTGTVSGEPVESTLGGFFKYTIEGETPNSDGKHIAAVVIASGCHQLKITSLSDGGAQAENVK